MITISYAGEEFDGVVIDQINTVRGEGTETLYRDEEGRYYLERHHEEEDGGYSEIHRVNLNAAILWAMQFCGNPTPLRQDAATTLMGLGLYNDPHPTSYHEIKAERGDQSSEEWIARVLAGTVQSPAPVIPHPEHRPVACTVHLRNAEDGSLWDKVELTQDLYDGVEEFARDRGLSFEDALVHLLREGVAIKLAEWQATGQVSLDPLPSRSRRHDPADEALLAAAAPEAVDPVEEDERLPVEEHVDEPRPIRAVLADLAADWRAKAKEARAQAQDLQPFNASHKLHGQADLLEQCAATLAQAIAGANGEEGR